MSQLARWQRRKQARPNEILDAALALFVEKGFASTKLEDVARRAGIAKGTVYLYFTSKEELFRAVVQEVVIPEIAQAESNLKQHVGKQEDLLRKLALAWWTVVKTTKIGSIPKLMVSEAGQFPELAQFYVKNVVLRIRKIVIHALSTGVQTGEFAQMNIIEAAKLFIAPLVFLMIWDKSLAQYDTDSNGNNQEEYLQTHLSIFFRGLRK